MKDNFNPLDIGSWVYEFLKSLENIPIIGPIIKVILNCMSFENLSVAFIPILALFLRNGNEDMLGTLIVIVIFYILSIIGGVVLQFLVCDDSNKDLSDKIISSAQGTWYIPLIFTIFMVVNWFIKQPFMLAYRSITFLITFFIQNALIFGLVMYYISWQNYCVFRTLVC